MANRPRVPNNGFGLTEPDMLHEIDKENTVNGVLRVVDWKWLAGILAGVIFWGANQWVQYNELIKSNILQSAEIVKLVAKIEAMSTQLNDNKADNMKQDFEIVRLKDNQITMQAQINQVLTTLQPRK